MYSKTCDGTIKRNGTFYSVTRPLLNDAESRLPVVKAYCQRNKEMKGPLRHSFPLFSLNDALANGEATAMVVVADPNANDTDLVAESEQRIGLFTQRATSSWVVVYGNDLDKRYGRRQPGPKPRLKRSKDIFAFATVLSSSALLRRRGNQVCIKVGQLIVVLVVDSIAQGR